MPEEIWEDVQFRLDTLVPSFINNLSYLYLTFCGWVLGSRFINALLYLYLIFVVGFVLGRRSRPAIPYHNKSYWGILLRTQNLVRTITFSTAKYTTWSPSSIITIAKRIKNKKFRHQLQSRRSTKLY